MVKCFEGVIDNKNIILYQFYTNKHEKGQPFCSNDFVHANALGTKNMKRMIHEKIGYVDMLDIFKLLS